MTVVALKKNGDVSECHAKPENFGKPPCNHVAHGNPGESKAEFAQRNVEKIKELKVVSHFYDNLTSRAKESIDSIRRSNDENVSLQITDKFQSIENEVHGKILRCDDPEAPYGCVYEFLELRDYTLNNLCDGMHPYYLDKVKEAMNESLKSLHLAAFFAEHKIKGSDIQTRVKDYARQFPTRKPKKVIKLCKK